MKLQTNKRNRRGAALLVVLLIVMTATILSLGFLSRSDVELSCGRNMAIRAQMDYLAESALEHAKGLILTPQNISTEYWQGDTRQQLAIGNNYYDVAVSRTETDFCDYQITCEGYTEENGVKTSRSRFRAELRLDPCIALSTGGDWKSSPGTVINGDVYCGGNVTKNAA